MIAIQGVSKNYNDIAVLKDVNLEINEGEIFGIIGKSGAGKSTLLRCLNGLEGYTEGSIKVMGEEVKELTSGRMREFRKEMGMIFQNFNLLNTSNVFDNIALPLKIWNKDKKYIKERVTELLNLVGLKDKKSSYPRELSGGQKQRVAIARALTLEPKILLCDEATSALDPETTKSILSLLKEINEKLNITVIIVTHQMEVIKEICNKVALIEGGEIKTCGLVKELFLKPEGELKRLLEGDELLPNDGVNIKIFFPGEVSESSIITSMARELDIDFSIVWGKLENFRQEVLGSLIINVNKEYKEKICSYLSSKSIGWEEM
ncbi:methionine ABC transporter ATP-binding protein [Clostridium sp. MSJ-11]|uniref:Methionine ABC transporter ATP-binding protein n=1 Tax=Clostridium mobile TaxID=2841512 RepID=A0ABS6ECE5_9CLOT|nr:methionine ABC transporter ATP-binding protein [Clostridium mobile]MBU5482873.1 methionine ABC transporter ATP-binding protein [Clostridium mobile]